MDNDRTITLSDEDQLDSDFNAPRTKQDRDTLTQKLIESHIGQDGSNVNIVEEVKTGP